MKEVTIEVKSVKGYCSAGYKPGDKLTFRDPVVTAVDGKPVCLYALAGLIPYLAAFGRDTDQNDWINKIQELQCPDPVNTVVFSLKRSE
jgi:uncharacterized repeat protein (TIGR04076 family)